MVDKPNVPLTGPIVAPPNKKPGEQLQVGNLMTPDPGAKTPNQVQADLVKERQDAERKAQDEEQLRRAKLADQHERDALNPPETPRYIPESTKAEQEAGRKASDAAKKAHEDAKSAREKEDEKPKDNKK